MIMTKQLLSVLVATLVLAGGAFVLFKMKQTAVVPMVTEPTVMNSVEAENGEWATQESLPVLDRALGLQHQIDQIKFPEGELYVSEKNKFSIMVPSGTRIEERDEISHRAVYLILPKSKLNVSISSYDGNINGANLKSVIASGQDSRLFQSSFTSKSMVQCGESSSLCSLDQQYAHGGYPLVGITEDIVSRAPFPKFYKISLSYSDSADLTEKDLAIFNMIHNSFNLLR